MNASNTQTGKLPAQGDPMATQWQPNGRNNNIMAILWQAMPTIMPNSGAGEQWQCKGTASEQVLGRY